LHSELDYLTIEEIIQIGLHEFLDHLQQQMNGVGDFLRRFLEPIR